ncbi:MAG: 30S ribosomal protein S13 [Rickettsia sp.]|nr:30S ribosomal protein S13 [Rickettsia sp.]
MARIAGINIPINKRLVVGLTYIFGIGSSFAHSICNGVGISKDKKIKNLNDEELTSLRNFISQSFKIEGDLRREIQLNIKRKRDLRSYQGMAHIRGLPVRGQNTKSNAKTAKKRRRK